MANIVVDTSRAERRSEARQPSVIEVSRDRDDSSFGQSMRESRVEKSNETTVNVDVSHASQRTKCDSSKQCDTVKSDRAGNDEAVSGKTISTLNNVSTACENTANLSKEADQVGVRDKTKRLPIAASLRSADKSKLGNIGTKASDPNAADPQIATVATASPEVSMKTDDASTLNGCRASGDARVVSDTESAGAYDPILHESALPIVIATMRTGDGTGLMAGHPKKAADIACAAAESSISLSAQTKKIGIESDIDGDIRNGIASKGKADIGTATLTTELLGGIGTRAGSLTVSSRNSPASDHLASAMGRESTMDRTAATADTHDAIYGGREGGGPGVLIITPSALEVGVANGTHGWLKIRTEMADGVVTASLSATSAAGNEMLHRELPALISYLHEERIGLSGLVIKHAPTLDASSFGASQDSQRRDGLSQQGFQSFHRPAREDSQGSGDFWSHSEQGAMGEAWSGLGVTAGFLPSMAGGNGSWLNVRV